MTERGGSAADYTPRQVEAAQSVYTKAGLSLYDFVVLGLTNRLLWRCPTRSILDLYNRNVTGLHLDVGVGTGYYLNRCRFPSAYPRITLFDLNPNCLEKASRAISRYGPANHRGSLLDPIGNIGEPFDSISCTYVLHCLPGSPRTKDAVIGRLAGLLSPRGVLFGAAVYLRGVPVSWPARRLMEIYLRKGIFNNREDRIEDLRASLDRRFQESEVRRLGCVALFWGRGPTTPSHSRTQRG